MNKNKSKHTQISGYNHNEGNSMWSLIVLDRSCGFLVMALIPLAPTSLLPLSHWVPRALPNVWMWVFACLFISSRWSLSDDNYARLL